jgi:hypothetical protein
VSITDETAYQFELRNAMNLSPAHPRDEIWIGVSASDDQPYVGDKLAPAEDRKGNESPIVPFRVQGRFQGRPQFDVPPPMEDVPRLLTREPETAPIRFRIQPADFLEPGTLSGVTHIRLERTDAGTVFNRYRAASGDRVMAVAPSPAQPDVEVTVPNPDDKNNILEALRKVDASGLADRYLVFLAGSHPDRAAFFEPVTADPVSVGTIEDSFLPQTNRFVYRVRTGNAAGLISAGDAMLAVVVRVPSLKPGPVPELIARKAGTALGSVPLRIARDESVTHAVVFYDEASSGGSGPQPKGSLLRTTNRPDLYPEKLLRFRTPAGNFARSIVKDLGDPDVTEEEGAMIVSIPLEENPGKAWRVWACTLTRDGIPCEPAGPWRILAPARE